MSDPVDRIRDIIDGHCGDGDTLAQIAAVLGYGDSDSPPVVPASEQPSQLLAALRPFAEIGRWMFARSLPDETPVVDIGGLHGQAGTLTRGDFKAAARAYSRAPMASARDAYAYQARFWTTLHDGKQQWSQWQSCTREQHEAVQRGETLYSTKAESIALYTTPPADARDGGPTVTPIPAGLLAAADALVNWLSMAETNGWLGNYHESYARLAREKIALYRAAKIGSADPDGGVEAFLSEVRAELVRARAKFPGDRVMVIALAEEFGELCKAVLDESSARVRKEAVQTAVMAARVVLDGDGSVREWRSAKKLDPLVADRAMGGE